MAYLLAALVILLKVFGILLAALVTLVVLLASLPIKLRVSGSAATAGLLEGILEDDATVVVRAAGPGGDLEGGPAEGVIPVDVDFRLDSTVLAGAVGFAAGSGSTPEVTALGLSFRIRGRGGKAHKSSGGKPKTRRVKRGGISLKEVRKYLAPEVRKKTWEFLGSLVKTLHLGGDLDIECGFPDPGATGMVFAGYWALGGPYRLKGVNFRPNFQGESFDVRGTGEMRFVPAQIGWIAARYLLSREIRPLWRRSRVAEADRSVGAVSAN